MDTHIAPHPEAGDRPAPLRARLPREPLEAEEHDSADAAALGAASAPERLVNAPTQRRKRRRSLLLGVSVVALGVAGGCAFLVSPYNHVVPVPGMARSVQHVAAAAGIHLPGPLAPAASLADVHLPPAPDAVIRPRYTALPPDQELSELMRLHPGTPAMPPIPAPHHEGPGAIAVPPDGAEAPPPGYLPREPGSQRVVPLPAPAAVPPPQPVAAQGAEPQGSHDVAAAVIASLSDASHQRPAEQELSTSKPAAAPASAPPAPTDALKIAGELRAAPMTPPQEVQVLDLVTQIATMVRDLKTENAQLRADVSRSSTDTTARLADFERRLALTEARNAVSAAKAAGTEPAAPAPSAIPVKAAAAPVMLTRAEATLAVPEKDGPKRYRVQAASPGLALLAEVDRGGGEGAQIQLTVGDTLPGYGRVKSIAQHGTTWVVTTDHGNIQ